MATHSPSGLNIPQGLIDLNNLPSVENSEANPPPLKAEH
jgi:hypothetical protein